MMSITQELSAFNLVFVCTKNVTTLVLNLVMKNVDSATRKFLVYPRKLMHHVILCRFLTFKKLPCGHVANNILCHKTSQSDKIECSTPVEVTYPLCNHTAKIACYKAAFLNRKYCINNIHLPTNFFSAFLAYWRMGSFFPRIKIMCCLGACSLVVYTGFVLTSATNRVASVLLQLWLDLKTSLV